MSRAYVSGRAMGTSDPTIWDGQRCGKGQMTNRTGGDHDRALLLKEMERRARAAQSAGDAA
jgi:hypothetical protein